MRILHTSDWHLGHRFIEQSQQYEQEKFLEWLIETLKSESVDVLLVSGDIFDTAYPSSQSLDMFYRFLAKVYKSTNCKKVVMTAGNHDSPGTINAPDNFVRNFDIYLIGKAGDNIEDEILEFEINDEKLTVAAVPFLRDRDIRKAVAGESAEIIEKRYYTALVNHYRRIAGKINEISNPGYVIAMGHLFATGAQTSESEQRIYAGNLGDISAEDFPDAFDYIALGHLHRAQTVGGKNHIRYPGSPYILSFSETGSQKKVIIITTDKETGSIREIEVPKFRKIVSIKGKLDECKGKLEELSLQTQEPESFVEVIIDDKDVTSTANTEINDFAENLNLKILKVRIATKTDIKGLEKLVDEEVKIDELNPVEVFKNKCKEEDFNIDENPEILDAFNEILSIIEIDGK